MKLIVKLSLQKAPLAIMESAPFILLRILFYEKIAFSLYIGSE